MKKGPEGGYKANLTEEQKSSVESYNQRVEKIISNGLKTAGVEGTTYKHLLELLESHPSGMVDMEVGEELVPVKYTEWDETPGYEAEVRPIIEGKSVYDSDDLNEVLERLMESGKARYDKALKKWFSI